MEGSGRNVRIRLTIYCSRKMANGVAVIETWRGSCVVKWTQISQRLIPKVLESTSSQGWRKLGAAFVPEGKVSSDYFSFQVGCALVHAHATWQLTMQLIRFPILQVWDSVQGVCSYVRGMLSSQAILQGVGVGRSAATTSSAVFHFFLRDFSGMLGGVLFAMLNVRSLEGRVDWAEIL